MYEYAASAADRDPDALAAFSFAMATFACTICGRPVTYKGALPALYPFCSDRCRWVDLGRWLRGGYVLERDLSAEEIEQARLAERFRTDPPTGDR